MYLPVPRLRSSSFQPHSNVQATANPCNRAHAAPNTNEYIPVPQHDVYSNNISLRPACIEANSVLNGAPGRAHASQVPDAVATEDHRRNPHAAHEAMHVRTRRTSGRTGVPNYTNEDIDALLKHSRGC